MRTLKSFVSACLLLFFLCISPLPARAEGAEAFLLLDADTGSILAEENADIPTDPGTFSKLMTAYLTAQAMRAGQFTPETALTAGESVTGMQGAVIWLERGDSIPVGELLYGLLVGNANDAAAVLADAVSGDSAHFVMDMNAAAFDLGMRDTWFTSPQGFDDPAAHTTARDLGRLASAVLGCPELSPYLSTWRIFSRDGATELVSENTLTRTYDGCCGLKAAHTDGRYSVIAAASREGMTCAAVVLGCQDKDERFTTAKQLLNKAFAGYRRAAPGYAEEFLVPLRLRGGTEQAVLLDLETLPVLTVPAGSQLTSVTVLPEFRKAPVRQGEQVGAVYFYLNDTLLAESALCAAEDVPALRFSDAWRRAVRALFS